MSRDSKHYDIEKLIGNNGKNLEFALLSFDELRLLFERMDANLIEQHHKHTFYIIAWLDNGSCTQVLDRQVYRLKKQNLFFVCPGQMHENNLESSKDFSGGVMLLSSGYFAMLRDNQHALLELTFIDNAFGNPKLELKSEPFQIIRQTIDLISSEINQNTPKHGLIFQALLVVLFLQLQRQADKDLLTIVSKHSLTIYKQFKCLVELHYTESKSIEDYADKLNITTRHLRRITKEISGKTPAEILKSRIILEAKRLLTTTDNSVSEIAYQLGFSDNSYFSKVFKKEVEITPGEFNRPNVRNLP